MGQNEPGLDLHEWETRWSELEAMMEDDPAGALAAACDVAEQMLTETGVASGAGGENDELLAGYRAARDTSNRIERGEDVDPGDVGAAIENLRRLHDTLRAGRQA
jgi:hypothetical protein